jgi:hypothetical protein
MTDWLWRIFAADNFESHAFTFLEWIVPLNSIILILWQIRTQYLKMSPCFKNLVRVLVIINVTEIFESARSRLEMLRCGCCCKHISCLAPIGCYLLKLNIHISVQLLTKCWPRHEVVCLILMCTVNAVSMYGEEREKIGLFIIYWTDVIKVNELVRDGDVVVVSWNHFLDQIEDVCQYQNIHEYADNPTQQRLMLWSWLPDEKLDLVSKLILAFYMALTDLSVTFGVPRAMFVLLFNIW